MISFVLVGGEYLTRDIGDDSHQRAREVLGVGGRGRGREGRDGVRDEVAGAAPEDAPVLA